MRSNFVKTTLKTAVLAVAVLLLGVSACFAQVSLTAARTSLTLPDGNTVPMWGYSCTAATGATCAALNPAAGTGWSPVVITVQTGQDLTINLTNNLPVPTSLVIVGQLGGGLGTGATHESGPVPHGTQQVTWPTANSGPKNVPPPQQARLRSFATEVASGGMQTLTWTAPRPGTYLIESGTHAAIQGPMGLYGILVVTCTPGSTSGCTAGTAYPGVSYSAEVPLLLSEIDPVQNTAADTASMTAGFSETTTWTGGPSGCGANFTCYPPAVNYTPLYYMINGVAFSRASISSSQFATLPATGVTGNVLVRLVNAGLRMHVPSIVGSATTPPIVPTGVTATAVPGFSLIAEDGNPLPGASRVQSDVFMAAGKTYDVMINAPASGASAIPVYDRELSLSGNSINRDSGMLAYINVNSSVLPAAASLGAAVARNDTYNSLAPGQILSVSDPSRGLLANDTNVSGATLLTAAANGTVVLNANGTFTYTPAGTATSDSFTYCANGTVTGTTCSSGITATVTLGAAPLTAGSSIIMGSAQYMSTQGTFIKVPAPGPLFADKDPAGYPLTVVTSSIPAVSGLTLNMDANGGFNATAAAPGTYQFTYKAQNTQGTQSASTATVTLIFPVGNGPNVTVVDGATKAALAGQDYRWIIEEDRSFYIDPNNTTNTGPSGPITPILGVNFHTSDMSYVAQGCTGPLSCESGQMLLGVPAACDVGNGSCRTTASQKTATFPSSVHLDATKRYYISVLPGDAANPFSGGNTTQCAPYSGVAVAGCGHSMGGAPIPPGGSQNVTVLVQQDPFPPGRLSVNVFEDDFPLNGEQDSGGQIIDTSIAGSLEPGLSSFNIILWDDMGNSGDVTGQMTYDMFNQPLGNALDGYIDPATGFNACPITNAGQGITGMIVTCPNFESDGVTTSPLRGQAVVANMMPGRFSVQAIPGADRIARGEEWLQTNTLDGQKAHDSFIRIGEPSYFQEFGPAGYHVNIGFANPKIINGRLAGVCNGSDPNLQAGNCYNTLKGIVTTERMSRTPDERLYSSGTRDSFYFTQCFVSVGDPDGEDFAFTKCNADGTFTLSGLPDGNWRITTFDQWNDQIVDGLSTPIGLVSNGVPTTTNIEIAASQWQANVYTRTFVDDNKDGVSQKDEAGIPLINTTVRYRDGSRANFLGTDFNGIANFNETFPLFNWYVVETDNTRYKTTGIHVVYDAGGPADGSASCGQLVSGYPLCGGSTIGKNLANTYDANPLPTDLSVPGTVYCSNADCTGSTIASSPVASSTSNHSTGRIDAPWVVAEGWQGFSGQNSFIEFGKTPYVPGENGGIQGHVVYASTRPFDDPQMNVQQPWEPLIPHVTVNLYKEGFAADGVTPTLTLVDTTTTSSFDDWAQGFRSDGIPNMNCPGQSTADLFYFSLYNQPNYLNVYNSLHGGPAPAALPYNSQYKCYDGMHNWNQVQPAPYDGMYSFPSVTGRSTTTGNTTGTNCTICTKDPDPTDTFRYNKEDMLPAGKYVVEVVPPPGYEIVKEEDKNILIGDQFIAPAVQEFGGLGNIFIIPDQASVSSQYNAYNAQNPTQNLGTSPNNQIVPGFVPEPVWPCVGELRTVPDYISLFPQSTQVSPFAGASRHLCDRKEVVLGDQMGAIAKFYLYTSTHKASKFTGVITDDFTSEFDPFSPQFGEKFAPANQPIAVRDWTGAEINRVYSDWWGDYDGLTYSTWEVNPPNPTGYSPTMMVFCMNDKTRTDGTTDPLYNSDYSQFCYELPFMPGQTQYLDTPVVPTSAFSAGYNHADCNYPDATPAISRVDGDGTNGGPWVSAAGVSLKITSLPDQQVANNAYSGPAATTAPYNAKTVNRHYGFGTTTGTVTIGGVAAAVTGWSDTQITVTVPSTVPACAVQQQAQYGGSSAKCGELVITAANGKQSIDAVTVTIGGKKPTYVLPPIVPMSPNGPGSVQAAINAAMPGDLIMLPPGTYTEMLLMWKPLRLQGFGAASSIIDANAHPAGKMGPWRQQVDCLFGMAPAGTPTGFDPACGSGWTAFGNAASTGDLLQIDRLPLEAVVGWDATLNGNLAELLQEPTLMGAYEGAGITVLAKGVNYHGGNAYASDIFPVGTTLLTTADCTANPNPYPSNFQCNPSRIDGLGITDSSQGGGGVFVHAWGHNMEIANNRIYSNIGTLTGGINVGQGEFPPQYLAPNASATNAAPGSCQDSSITNQQLPYCFNLHVNVHNNSVTSNASIGDELFSATPAGAGGVSFCTGADYYKFNYNWVCGNLSSGDGGGVAHLGYMWNGDIEHNTIVFNQSINPTIPTNGGGLLVMGAPDTDPVCGTAADADCPPGLSDGTGPNLVINANLIMGNSAESGSGGGLRLQGVNGTEVTNFPNTPANWYHILVTNNIISNNVAGWDGGGVSLQDAIYTDLINNTLVSNDTTASSGVLFDTIGAPLASAGGTNAMCDGGIQSCPQPAGLVAVPNSSPLVTALGALPAGTTVTCPTNHYSGTVAKNGSCTKVSFPYLANDLFWQNRAFVIGVGSLSAQYQQNIIALYNAKFNGAAATAQVTSQTTTGACVAGSSYWDIGVRGDMGPANHASGFTLAPRYSVLTDVADYPGLNNLGSNPAVISQYCNGSRIPPEFAHGSFNVPPGISDATVPNPIFNLTPAATVDEGNNWINLTWGPLSLTNPTTTGTDGNYGGGSPLGNYSLASNSPAVDAVPKASSAGLAAPTTDFFGNPRPDPAVPTFVDIGAVEIQTGAIGKPALTSISPTSGVRGTTFGMTLTGTNLTYITAVNVNGTGVTCTLTGTSTATTATANCTITSTALLGGRLVSVTAFNGTSNTVPFTVVGATLATVAPNFGYLGTTVAMTFTGTNLTGTTAVNMGAPNNGVACTITGTSATTVTANCTIAAGAPIGTRNVYLVTPIGNTNTLTAPFTVEGTRLNSITPSSVSRSGANPHALTLSGLYMTGATQITVAGAGVTCTITGTPTATTVTANCTVTATAGLGGHAVRVVAPAGTSNAQTLTVTP